ncbi:MAG: ABC transporter permease [Acidobacteria bacterium]|nr:ABC transporter permease [Acidobacteriota bacterium]
MGPRAPAPRAPADAGSAEAATADDSLAPLPEGPRILIESEESGVRLNLGEVWAYRELLYFLTRRDIKVRYKQTLLGAAWVIIQPLLMMLIVTLVFNRFARLDAGPMPYPLFAYSGLLLWTFFASGVTNGTNSLISNSNLITKVYFPRMFIPAAAVGAGLFDLGIASLLLLALAVYYGVALTWGLLLLPVFVLLATVLALGVGMMVAALTVKYRDLRHALPFIIQFLMFASPVIYPSRIVPGRWRWILVVNPLTGIIEGFRAALSGQALDWTSVAASAVVSFALLILAVYVFRRAEDSFADVI